MKIDWTEDWEEIDDCDLRLRCTENLRLYNFNGRVYDHSKVYSFIKNNEYTYNEKDRHFYQNRRYTLVNNIRGGCWVVEDTLNKCFEEIKEIENY